MATYKGTDPNKDDEWKRWHNQESRRAPCSPSYHGHNKGSRAGDLTSSLSRVVSQGTRSCLLQGLLSSHKPNTQALLKLPLFGWMDGVTLLKNNIGYLIIKDEKNMSLMKKLFLFSRKAIVPTVTAHYCFVICMS